MSHTRLTASSSSNFRLIFDDALKAYKKRAKKDLLSHPLATQLQACDSPASILALLHNQVQDFNQSRNNDERLFKWLDPMVNVLYALSATLGEGVGLVFSPAKVIFAGVGVLLLAAKDVRASQDTLVDIFERIECFFRRLETYTEVPVTPEMTDIIIQIMVEVLSILGIATSEMKDGRMRKYAKKLVGRTDLEDALHRLDKLTQEEARMATTEVLKVTHTVDKNVRGVSENMVTIDHRVDSVDDRVAGVREKVDSIDNKVANVDNTVVGIDGKMGAIGESVAGIDRSLKGIDTRVAGVHDSVRAVDEKVTIIIDDGNKAKQVIQQTVNDLDQITNCEKAFINGYPHRTHLQTTTLRMELITKERQPGSSKEASLRSGRQVVHYFGSTENLARARAFSVPRSSKIFGSCVRLDKLQWLISTLTFGISTNNTCVT
ncbi:hypothetical protein F5148DRAFT_448005 [Russula earlei]|uniref:Uncharacterized protein n=1 Tax=Russula earlei TaxID=71964 RepID=A0ACC0TZZ1_9AGAM|nr:hypothetical protein F5148DRAFT_448005 [Russula earlei]